MLGRLQAEEIITPQKLQNLLPGHTYWQESDGTLLPIAIITTTDTAAIRVGLVRWGH
jgi:hypothetical protein